MNALQIDLDLVQAKQAAMNELMDRDLPPGNVVGVGIGKNHLRIYVENLRLSPVERVRKEYLGIPTDVIEIGRLGRNGRKPKKITDDSAPQPGSRIRVKTDAPNVNSGATGTIGMKVADNDGHYILGCNHILAVNGRVPKNAEIVWAKFVDPEEAIAVPYIHVPLSRHCDNPVDCALARIKEPDKVQAMFPASIGMVNDQLMAPQHGMTVTKAGATTDTTDGAIVDISADLYVEYSFGRFRFANQVVVKTAEDELEFATRGDSGSIVVSKETNQPVAMIFAASGTFAVACQLSEVLTLLQEKIPKKDQTKLADSGNGNITLKLVTR
jgi:hypothetical protein